MPVRQIGKSYRNVTGIVASAKAAGQAQFESTLERDFLALLEFSPDVLQFEVQPVALRWNDGSRERRYTPDVLVHYKERHASEPVPVLYEVKYRSDLRDQWRELKPKFRAALRFAAAQGWRFRLISEIEIRTPYLDNVRFLLPFVRRGPPPADDMDLLDCTLARLGAAEAQGLLQAACRDEWNRARLMPALWYLVATLQVGADLQAPLNMRTLIRSKG